MGRAPCCEKVGIKKGRWTAEEDQILSNYIMSNGEGSWRSLPKNAGLKRCGKSCRLRWINYLRSDLKRGNITPEEEELVVKMHSTLGNRWSIIASHLPGRTDNEIKNYWNSHLSRKLHNFIKKPSAVTHNAATVETHNSPVSMQPKRRPGRTSRAAMKPKTHNSKTRKTKNKTTPFEPKADVEVVAGEEAAALMMELSVAETELGPCDYIGTCHAGGSCCNNSNNLTSINDDNGVLSLDDDILDLLLDEYDPGHVFTSCGGDGDVELNRLEESGGDRGLYENACPSVESLITYEHQVTDEFIDWDCVCKESNISNNLWSEKEGSDSMVSWLLDGDDESTTGKSNSGSFGEPLDHNEENALVAWLLS